MKFYNTLNIMKYILYVLALIGLPICYSPAWAAACIDGGGMITTTISGSVDLTYNGKNTNGVFWDSTAVNGGSSMVVCNTSFQKTTGYVTAMTPSDITGIYKTGIDGIGIKVYAYSSPSVSPDIVLWPAFSLPTDPGTFTPFAMYQIQLVLTGKVKPGVYSLVNLPEPLAQVKYDAITTSKLSVAGLSIVVRSNTCEAVNSSTTVPIPKVGQGQLSTVGAVSPETPFSIGLKCFGNPSVFMAFTDNADPANTSTTLSPGVGSMAKGVGLQILYKTKPVQYGPDISSSSALNAIPIGIQSDNSNIPLSVRYIGTGTVDAGVLNGTATFVLSYQ